MTTEEMVQSLQNQLTNQGDMLERHSKRLEKLERSNEDIQEIKGKVGEMDKRMKKMESRQTIMESKLMKKNNFMLVLLFVIIGLLAYIAVKSPETAKDVVGIAGSAVTQGIKTAL